MLQFIDLYWSFSAFGPRILDEVILSQIDIFLLCIFPEFRSLMKLNISDVIGVASPQASRTKLLSDIAVDKLVLIYILTLGRSSRYLPDQCLYSIQGTALGIDDLTAFVT